MARFESPNLPEIGGLKTERVRKSIAKPYRLNAVCGNAGDQLQAFAPGSPTTKSVLGGEVPARKKRGRPEHQPSFRIEQYIAPDAMCD
jgi:hypothetical protein